MRRALVAIALLSACGQQDGGFDAWVQIGGAQFFRGATPTTTDGPAITNFYPTTTRLAPGIKGWPLSGQAPLDATAIAIYFEGDKGYWIVQPGTVDPQLLDVLNFSASLSFAASLPPGQYKLLGRAIDQNGEWGAPAEVDLHTADVADNATLTVSLAWDTEADLDLHLVTPTGEVWAKRINSTPKPPPGTTPDPNAWKSGGILDFDSNGNCIIDGRRKENVYWTQPPPSGHYIARVDAFSLCGEADAIWTVTTSLGGMAQGRALPTDTQFDHGEGAGVTALEFDIP
jgi:hypothetical protein